MRKLMILFMLLSACLFAANVEIIQLDGNQAYPLKTTEHVYAGDAICIEGSSGYARQCADTSGYQFVGICASEINNTGGSGAKWVEVRTGAFKVTFTSITQAMVGDLMYVTGAQTFDETNTNGVIAGRLEKYISATSGYLDTAVGVAVGSTIIGSGVSISDTGDYYTSNDVESAFAQIGGLPRGYMAIGSATGKYAEVDCNGAGEVPIGDGTSTAPLALTTALTTYASVTRGYLPRGSAAGKMEFFDANGSGEVPIGDGTDVGPLALTTALTTYAQLARGFCWRGSATGLMEAYDCNGNAVFMIGDGVDVAAHAFTGPVAVDNTGLSSIVDATLVSDDILKTVTNRTQTVDYCFWWDFATSGGAQGTIQATKCGVVTAQSIPDNFTITNLTYEMSAALVGGAGTVKLGLGAVTDAIIGDQVEDHAQYAINIAKAGTAATTILKTTGAVSPNITITTANLTAGTIYFYVSGHQSN